MHAEPNRATSPVQPAPASEPRRPVISLDWWAVIVAFVLVAAVLTGIISWVGW